MRIVPDDARALLSRRRRRVNYEVTVERRDGSVVKLNQMFGREWVKSLRISEDIDNPSGELQLEVQREWEQISLSPLIEESRANRDASGELEALLDLDARIRVWVSVAPEQSFNESWLQVFRGRIVSVDPAASVIRVVARDDMNDLVTQWIEDKETELGLEGGQPVEALIGGILDGWAEGASLYTPVSPNWLVTPYKQERMPVYEALNTIVMQFGWDLRYRYTVGNLQQLTLYDVGRERTTPDFSFTHDDYFDLAAMARTLDGVRNIVRVGFGPSYERQSYGIRSSEAIERYRLKRVMWVEEADTSPIKTHAQAEVMARAMLADLKHPKFAMQARLLLFPWAQLGDIYKFEANRVHFDRDQQFSVSGYTHFIANGKAETTFRLRDGAPTAAYGRWLEREFRKGVKVL